jgi:hypothetical protein
MPEGVEYSDEELAAYLVMPKGVEHSSGCISVAVIAR